MPSPAEVGDVRPTRPEAPSNDAFFGLAGEIVRTIEPHSESDPAALLLQLLVAFGNVIDRGPHWRAEADRHALNLFVALVGETGKARKGSSWSHIRNLVARCDPYWEKACIQTGLSSGEGLIYAVRDATEARGPREADAGCLDSRLLVVESEFASPLRMITRDGNTLSPVVRQSWDGPMLQVMTRQFPIIATRAHVSIVAHITRDELLRELTRTDVANGFGNRFLWGWVRRSKLLPEGGCLPDAEFDQLTEWLREAFAYARSLEDYELRRTSEARDIWHSVYADLSEGKPGLCGAVTSRAEAQVMRVACLYALLDKSPEINPIHLRAALALWNYCEASAKYIFGDATGDPVAELLLSKLRASKMGLTKTELSSVLGRNRSAVDIQRALDVLAQRGLARMQTKETEGRPAHCWHATDSASA